MGELSINDVADTFLYLKAQTPKKLQKLCYYAYAWFLAFYDEKLFEEKFEAWVHGPVNPDLYQKYKTYGWNEIPQKTDIIPNPDLLAYVRNVYHAYGDFDGDALESLTHQEDPWKKARGTLSPWESSNNVIQDDDIMKYYRAQIHQ